MHACSASQVRLCQADVLVTLGASAGRGVPALLPDASLDEFADLLAATAGAQRSGRLCCSAGLG